MIRTEKIVSGGPLRRLRNARWTDFYSGNCVWGWCRGFCPGKGSKTKTRRTVSQGCCSSFASRIHRRFWTSSWVSKVTKKGELLPEDWTFEVRDQTSYAELAKVNFDLEAELLLSRLKKARWKSSQVTRFLSDNVTKSVELRLQNALKFRLNGSMQKGAE